MSTKVTIDEHRVTHVDGRPFFLIGARHMPDGGTPEILRDAGFNGYRRLAFGHDHAGGDPLPDGLDGIYFWAYVYDRTDFTKSPAHEKELEEKVAELRHHPAMLCYENLNEPTFALDGSGEFKARPKNLARGTARLRELDPDHPIWLAHTVGHTIETLARFNPCADVIGCNPYPVNPPGLRLHLGIRPDGRSHECLDQSVHAVGKYTEKMMTVGGGRLPVWMLLQGMANEHWYSPVHRPEMADDGIDESKVLYPTCGQMRFMAYDAIVAGATGMAWSMLRTPTEGRPWEDIKLVVGELRRLEPALTAPPVPGPVEISYTDLGFSIWDGVRTLVRRRGDAVFLFAVNTAVDPAQVAVRVPIEVGNGAVVEGEDRELDVRAGLLEDRFEGHAVHVYRMKART